MIISLMLLSSIFQSFYDISLDDVPSCTLLCDKVLEEFHFKWLKIKGIDATSPISLTLILTI